MTSGEVMKCALPEDCSDKVLLEHPGFDKIRAKHCENLDWYPKSLINNIMGRRLKKSYRMILKTVVIITVIAVLKWLWVTISTMRHGTFEGEKTEILRRRNYLTNKLLVSPEGVLNEMPGGIGSQFQGEWAMYSCSMLSAALANISILYPDEREKSVEQIDRLIEIVMSPELREYDAARWDEDPLESWDSPKSHMSYLSILAWMISGYKTASGDDKYDYLY